MWRAYVATSVWTTDTGSWLTLSPYTSFLDRRVSSSLLEAGTENPNTGQETTKRSNQLVAPFSFVRHGGLEPSTR